MSKSWVDEAIGYARDKNDETLADLIESVADDYRDHYQGYLKGDYAITYGREIAISRLNSIIRAIQSLK